MDSVWVVRFSNYEPAEIDSIWNSKEAAEKQANELGDNWYAEWWRIESEDED